jgi:DASH complex subunit DAM1
MPHAEEDARAAAEAAKAPGARVVTDEDKTTYNETADYETTFTTALTSTSANTKSVPKAVSKKKGKPKLMAKEKKEQLVPASLLACS